jgi:hypothetical protein
MCLEEEPASGRQAPTGPEEDATKKHPEMAYIAPSDAQPCSRTKANSTSRPETPQATHMTLPTKKRRHGAAAAWSDESDIGFPLMLEDGRERSRP